LPEAPALRWFEHDAGLYTIGHAEDSGEFAYDNEGPQHQVYLQPFAIASRPVTNGEFMAFIEDGGYERHDLWLDMGWATVNEQGWRCPLYWDKRDRAWWQFSLAGMQKVREHEVLTHVSYFEADAYARWAGRRLPTEQEWEVASCAVDDVTDGNFADAQRLHPAGFAGDEPTDRPVGLFGDGWEWTRSHYSPYPGYAAGPGALGEYNGKFMCNQFVLRGGSCATPVSHIRRTYRNFFPPEARWQFSAIRLAEDRS
jgi:ergothioneine biosynthesis protein EgtB